MADEAAKDYFAGLVDGHRDGESCRQNDWDMALDEILPTSVKSDPDAVADYIATLEGIVRRLRGGWAALPHGAHGKGFWLLRGPSVLSPERWEDMTPAEVLILKEMQQ